MICIVAEKPSVARDIAATLGSPEKHEGYLSVSNYAITWAFGHLATLADPKSYDPAWEKWSWESLPMLPEKFQLAPVAKTVAQLKIIHGLMKKSDSIICATDGDREGELIFRYIYRLAGIQKPVQRLWLSENTAAAIQKALAAMKPDSAYDALARAAEARSQADWLVGLNATRAFTLRHGQAGQGALSVGRVQTPTLALVASRDAEIAAFTPTPYFQITAYFHAAQGDYAGKWFHEKEDRFAEKSAAQAIQQRLGSTGTIQSIEIKPVVLNAPLLFSLNDLQKESNKRFGLTAQQTLDIAQSLYEKYHATSYPRTSAEHITKDIAATIPSRLKGLAAQYADLVAVVSDPLNVGRITNAAKVAESGHHAIIPTGTIPQGLSASEQQVFDLVVRRFLASLMPVGQDERTIIITEVSGEQFKTTGTVQKILGWRMALKPPEPDDADKEKADEENQSIPAGLAQGASVKVTKTDLLEKMTKAPPQLNDGSLLGQMEKFGLGTPATRARILEVLEMRGYITRKKKALVSTEKGQALLKVVPDSAKSPELTGQWESQLEAIAAGQGDARAFMAGIQQYTRQIVEEARRQIATVVGVDLGPCPVCHTGRIIPGKKAWGCNRWKDGCKFAIWREVAGKKLSESQIKTLLAGKVTAEIKGFKSKAGKDFSAKLQLVDNAVKFVFDKPKPAHNARKRA